MVFNSTDARKSTLNWLLQTVVTRLAGVISTASRFLDLVPHRGCVDNLQAAAL